MNTNEFRREARALMNEHGLHDWNFKFDRAKRRLGQCQFSTRTLSFSEPTVKLNDWETMRDTVLHEIAHAMVGASHGHDFVWRAQARAIGCTGERCSSSHEAAPASIEGHCPSCGYVHKRHRMPKSGARMICATPECRSKPKEERVVQWRRVR